MAASRFIPLSRGELVSLLGEDPAMRKACEAMQQVMRLDAHDAAEAARQAYGPFDPDPLMGTPRPGDPKAFLDVFDQVMEDANFKPVSRQELRRAFDERSLFPLHAEVDLDEYDILNLYRRGVRDKMERVRGWKTLWRWKPRPLVLYERLVVVLRLKESALAGKRTSRTEGMEAGRIYIKLFKNIPTADVEMVLPNTRLRMRPLDRMLVGGPLVGGVGITVWNSISLFIAFLTGAVALSIDDNRVRAIGGVLLVLAGYLWRTHSKVKTTRLEYLRTLSTGLYFRNLANNGAVIDQVLRFARDEEVKEAMLAFALLQARPLTAGRLDERAEAWLQAQSGRSTDFDVHDGLDSLERLGLAQRRWGKWHAVPVEEAQRLLAERWDRAL